MTENTMQFNKLFYPNSVAMFGATSDVRKWGFALFHNLLKGGFDKPIYPIHLKKDEVFGVKAYRSLDEIPGDVDLAIIVIPPRAVLDALDQCARKGVGAVVVNTGGFSETGEDGRDLEKKVARLARDAGMILIGPNCQGIMNTDAKLFPQMMGVYPPGGRISLLSQSGNIGGNLIGWGKKWNVHFGKFVSTGNEAVTTCADLINYLGTDPDTDVVCAYIEGVRDGAAFVKAVNGASRNKPVLILKGGSTEAGRAAAKSHTGSMAGQAHIFNAACKQAGAIATGSLEELFDLAAAFSALPLPGGNRVAIITHGGGWGVLAADKAQKAGLKLAELPQNAVEVLDEILPDRWSRGNPVDLAAGGGRGIVEKVLDVLIDLENVDAVLMLGIGSAVIFKRNIGGSSYHDRERIDKLSARAEEIEESATKYALETIKRTGKPILCCSEVVNSPYEAESAAFKIMAENGMVLYPSPERCVRTLAAMAGYSQRRQSG